MKKRAFTLTEVLIVLTVIGVITAIIVPIAFDSMPDEKIIKFKKANNIFFNVMHELVGSDKYYADGDLGIRASNGEYIDGTHDGDRIYFCQSMADNLSTKSVSCSEYQNNERYEYYIDTRNGYLSFGKSIEECKTLVDIACKKNAKNVGEEIVTTDGIVYYQVSPWHSFGIGYRNNNLPCTGELPDVTSNPRLFGTKIHVNSAGLPAIYKPLCMDIDGIPDNATADDCVNECPFGYMVRGDGKIITGARVDEWLEKDVQNND